MLVLFLALLVPIIGATLLICNEIWELREKLMSKLDEIKAAEDAAFEKMNAATTEVGVDLKRLRDEVAAQIKPGLTEAEADEVKESLMSRSDALVARLTEMAADPESPVPDAPDETA